MTSWKWLFHAKLNASIQRMEYSWSGWARGAWKLNGRLSGWVENQYNRISFDGDHSGNWTIARTDCVVYLIVSAARKRTDDNLVKITETLCSECITIHWGFKIVNWRNTKLTLNANRACSLLPPQIGFNSLCALKTGDNRNQCCPHFIKRPPENCVPI